MLRSLVGSEMCIRDSINAEYGESLISIHPPSSSRPFRTSSMAWQGNGLGSSSECNGTSTDSPTVATGLVIMGTVMVIAASFVSVCGINVQKLAHNLNQGKAKEDRISMVKDIRWWGGFLLMVGGSLLDLIALPFVPQSRVSALGASGIVANVIITPLFLKETPTRYDWIGCGVVTAGCTLATIFGASTEPDLTAHCLLEFFTAPAFVVYFLIITLMLCGLMYLIEGFRRKKNAVIAAQLTENDVFQTKWACEHRDQVDSVIQYQGRRLFWYGSARGPTFYPVVHAGFAGIAGAQSIMLAKAVLILLKDAFSGSGYAGLLLVAFLVPFALCLWLQITFLNIGLKIYPDALFVLPVYQSFWIVFGIASGLIFYQEYKDLTPFGYAMFFLGVAISLVGVAILSKRTSRARAPFVSGLEKPWCDEDGNELVMGSDEISDFERSEKLVQYEHSIMALPAILSTLLPPRYAVPVAVEDDFENDVNRRKSKSVDYQPFGFAPLAYNAAGIVERTSEASDDSLEEATALRLEAARSPQSTKPMPTSRSTTFC
eukprot:TRINITY_DN26213_c0_g1_i1.p1 TRINITY_DN26213_c0_g1~~TRINITY_DN26213_c0_g1_i1.p1  ORF type:complete len:545 (-),score=93.48 TRINITY_DN26213_c0_g1_i1:96-1730(-)